MELINKVALITGGASGLGLATAEVLIESGAKVMLLDLNEENAKVASEALGENASYVIANVTEEESVTNAIQETVSKFGSLHIVRFSALHHNLRNVLFSYPFQLCENMVVLMYHPLT